MPSVDDAQGYQDPSSPYPQRIANRVFDKALLEDEFAITVLNEGVLDL